MGQIEKLNLKIWKHQHIDMELIKLNKVKLKKSKAHRLNEINLTTWEQEYINKELIKLN